MHQIFEPQPHQHALREPDRLRDCAPTDVVGATPREGVRVTLLGLGVDLLLGGAKVATGLVSGSQALMADGLHSFSDALTDLMVIVMMRYSRQPPDDDHPYGHERFETLGTVMMGCLLLGVAFGLVWDSVLTLSAGTTGLEAGGLAITVALVSIAAKEWLFRHTKAVGERIQSDLIVSNAWHSRTDAASSVVVLIAIAGAASGLEWLDQMAAIAVALAIGKVGLGMTVDNVKELVDTAIAPDKRARILTLLDQHPSVRRVAGLRSRRMGNAYLLECTVSLPGDMTIRDGDRVVETLRSRVQEAFPEVRELVVRIEAEASIH